MVGNERPVVRQLRQRAASLVASGCLCIAACLWAAGTSSRVPRPSALLGGTGGALALPGGETRWYRGSAADAQTEEEYRRTMNRVKAAFLPRGSVSAEAPHSLHGVPGWGAVAHPPGWPSARQKQRGRLEGEDAVRASIRRTLRRWTAASAERRGFRIHGSGRADLQPELMPPLSEASADIGDAGVVTSVFEGSHSGPTRGPDLRIREKDQPEEERELAAAISASQRLASLGQHAGPAGSAARGGGDHGGGRGGEDIDLRAFVCDPCIKVYVCQCVHVRMCIFICGTGSKQHDCDCKTSSTRASRKTVKASSPSLPATNSHTYTITSAGVRGGRDGRVGVGFGTFSRGL